ncbi:unnamed protein product [Diatraea saccharalis]|uniref:Uncharacterized protein n=1 Tax=Diatraea saccharalis TaxID=40085 RepID=A0A9N9R3M5_9NEOP|nr:unnamed protein product [Diatraea saccharalis]
MLDWAFGRALITGPPAICNRIRGSATATEIFIEAVRINRPMSRRGTDRALSIEVESALSGSKKRRYSSDQETNDSWPDKAKRSRIEALEHRVNDMFSTIMERFDTLTAGNVEVNEFIEFSSNVSEIFQYMYNRSESPDDWNAPPVDSGFDLERQQSLQELDFLQKPRK